MNSASLPIVLCFALIANTVVFAAPQRLDMDAASAEVSSSYGKAEPEVQEFVLHTARSFGRSGLWLNVLVLGSKIPRLQATTSSTSG